MGAETMKLYTVTKWSEHYENNRSRQIADLTWVPIPNGHDGDGYCALMQEAKGGEIFAAWILILQVASRCNPRGKLIRDNGTPHTAQTLAMRTRGKVEWFTTALPILLEIGWLQAEEVETSLERQASVTQNKPTDEERKKEGIEEKEEKERSELPPSPIAGAQEPDPNLWPESRKPVTEKPQREAIPPDRIKNIHGWYCSLTAKQPLNMSVERQWYEFLKLFTEDDFKRVFHYLRARIRTKERNQGALKLSNMLQPDKFAEDLAMARTNINKPEPVKRIAPAAEIPTSTAHIPKLCDEMRKAVG